MVKLFEFIVIKVIYKWVAYWVLRSRLPKDAVHRIRAKFKILYKRLSQNLPNESSLMGKLAVRIGCAVLSLFQSITDAGFDKEEAAKLILQINWTCGKPLGVPLYILAAFFRRNFASRGRFIINLLYKFVFPNPPWERKIIENKGEIYRFHLTTCPFSDYFRSVNSPGLCSEVLCSLDFYMAEKWHVRFERKGTLVKGDPYCNFNYRFKKTIEKTNLIKILLII